MKKIVLILIHSKLAQINQQNLEKQIRWTSPKMPHIEAPRDLAAFLPTETLKKIQNFARVLNNLWNLDNVLKNVRNWNFPSLAQNLKKSSTLVLQNLHSTAKIPKILKNHFTKLKKQKNLKKPARGNPRAFLWRFGSRIPSAPPDLKFWTKNWNL